MKNEFQLDKLHPNEVKIQDIYDAPSRFKEPSSFHLDWCKREGIPLVGVVETKENGLVPSEPMGFDYLGIAQRLDRKIEVAIQKSTKPLASLYYPQLKTRLVTDYWSTFEGSMAYEIVEGKIPHQEAFSQNILRKKLIEDGFGLGELHLIMKDRNSVKRCIPEDRVELRRNPIPKSRAKMDEVQKIQKFVPDVTLDVLGGRIVETTNTQLRKSAEIIKIRGIKDKDEAMRIIDEVKEAFTAIPFNIRRSILITLDNLKESNNFKRRDEGIEAAIKVASRHKDEWIQEWKSLISKI